jgi:stress response protein SCP2
MPLGESQVVTLVDVHRAHHGQTLTLVGVCVNRIGKDYSTETAMIFGEIYRNNGDWKFRAVGQGYAGGLAAMCAQYSIDAQ